ncbi:MAG: RNA-binding protein [SAR324 cluster bacterium]|nr:RNA-binding protein [SAR324 cluster bacterium]MCZ6532232.1 RNA-binding protein [SAR324 cluster bacterium]MCZ6626676.1 RNA-binding protein [SAR324 cluster bacterium]MCZ6644952.1 RNA-binding protein [SAR324 cluster bacterium]MCZ6729667.1 RNA-binding protein [SAR324 cluster bacterium]
MTCKLYVGNLPFSTDEDTVRQLFAEQGTVESVKIVTDSYYGRSKGFGFVEMGSEEEASTAIEKLNGLEMEGRTLRVDKARPREPRRG